MILLRCVANSWALDALARCGSDVCQRGFIGHKGEKKLNEAISREPGQPFFVD